MSTVACNGEDALFIGDWNATPEEEPALGPLRSGRLHLADDVAGPLQLQGPTRTNGRHIDYALHTSNLVPRSKHQTTGPADHDLVVYTFEVFNEEPIFKVAPPRKLQAQVPVQPDAWSQHFPQDRFDQALCAKDVQHAWDILSDAAESVLQPCQGRKRSKIPRPTQPAKAPVKQDALQSVLERRLRRLHRRLLEFLKGSGPWSLLCNIRNDLRNLCHRCPELSEFQDLNEDLAHVIMGCIQKEMQAAKQDRLQRWQTSMEEDDQALIRWVKGADACSSPADDDVRVPVHPQLKAEFFAEQWKQVWNPDVIPDPGEVNPFLGWVPQGGFSCPKPTVTGAALKHCASKTVGKAPGADGWIGEHWSLLPNPFFDSLAALWQLVLEAGVLPEQWTRVRCVLIPKDVGFRPISVASLAWRVGMGVVLQQMTSWIDEWAPAELTGGLKGRSASQAHESLHESLQNSTLFGAKLDIAKCFDHVSVPQALHVWQVLGAPESVTTVLSTFYASQVKTMEWQGVSAKNAFSCKRGLLQGCPCSGALLAGLMATWVHHLKATGPTVHFSVFADDRTLWSDTLGNLQKAVAESDIIDKVFGFNLNGKKCEFFCKCSRSKAAGLKAWSISSNRKWPVTARLRRLRTATKNQRRKHVCVRSLVISLFAHTGPDCDPEYALDCKVTLHELWRLRCDLAGFKQVDELKRLSDAPPRLRSARFLEVLSKWRWQALSETRYDTPCGEIDLLFDGARTVKAAMRAGWELNLWAKEPRAGQVDPELAPVIRQHCAWLTNSNTATRDLSSFSVALGAGKEARKLAKQLEVPLITCACGEQWPTRHHVTWQCAEVPRDTEAPELPSCKSEERLLIRCLPRPPRPANRRDEFFVASQQIVDMLRRCAPLTVGGKVLMATDGSSKVLSGQRRAAGACACAHGSLSWAMQGCDQTSFTAEAGGVLKVFQAAQAARVSVCLLCDCLSVVRTAAKVMRGGPLPDFAPGLWKSIALTANGAEIHWVPAHGKHLQWLPPHSLDASRCRQLNDVADRSAQNTASEALTSLTSWKHDQDQAAAWSQAALLRQRFALRWLESHARSSLHLPPDAGPNPR
ncbi:unnamed protein product [Symbiodinium natans]|uniref:Reverse transcriptase domain-containing protein n=1 Tax=Symbiodinium natans TaxID=878477 RepID=A0A812RVF4_9DINO|nr:unnamed protein product [Symbiodinium natans]